MVLADIPRPVIEEPQEPINPEVRINIQQPPKTPQNSATLRALAQRAEVSSSPTELKVINKKMANAAIGFQSKLVLEQALSESLKKQIDTLNNSNKDGNKGSKSRIPLGGLATSEAFVAEQRELQNRTAEKNTRREENKRKRDEDAVLRSLGLQRPAATTDSRSIGLGGHLPPILPDVEGEEQHADWDVDEPHSSLDF